MCVSPGHLKASGCQDSIFSTPTWGQTLYAIKASPQRRPAAWSKLKALKKMDCNPGQELGNCSQYLGPPYTESECKSACESNPLCGGFNLPNGHLKTVDCRQEIRADKTQDLYVLEK